MLDKMRYVFNREKAREIFPKLVDSYKDRRGIFGYSGLYPELPLPEKISWGSGRGAVYRWSLRKGSPQMSLFEERMPEGDLNFENPFVV